MNDGHAEVGGGRGRFGKRGTRLLATKQTRAGPAEGLTPANDRSPAPLAADKKTRFYPAAKSAG